MIIRTSRPLFALALGFAVALAPVSTGQVIDQIAATVDTEVILLSDLYREAGPAIRELKESAASQEEFDRAAQQLLDDTLVQAVESKILIRQAQLSGIEVTDDQVEQNLEATRKDLQLESDQAFIDYVAQYGETLGDYRDQLEKRLMAVTMARRKMNSFEQEIAVSEPEVVQYYEDNKDTYQRKERIRVRQIMLRVDKDNATERAAAKARLESLREELDAGADFAELAKAHSQAPGAEDGGIVPGWQERGSLVPEIEAAVFDLPAGTVSAVVESEFGVHVMKVEGREEAGQASIDEVRVEIGPLLRQREAQKRYEKWMADLRKSSKVRVFI